MSKVYLEDSTLTSIADAIRAKTGESGTITPADMATEIESISGDPVIESKTITANGTYTAPTGVDGYSPITVDVSTQIPQIEIANVAHYLNYNGFYDFLYLNYINNITTRDLGNIEYIFFGDTSSDKQSLVEDLSGLTLNFPNRGISCKSMFHNNVNLKKLPKIGNIPLQITFCDNAFFNTRSLIDFGDFGDNTKVSFVRGNYQRQASLANLYTIRVIPSIWLKDMVEASTTTSYFQNPYYGNFYGNYNIDEYNGIGVLSTTFNSNIFSQAFGYNGCLKKLTFVTNNGIPYSVQWKNQTIDLVSYPIGYCITSSILNNYIKPLRGSSKEVIDAASYEALKNDPDWYTTKMEYSKYNHDSAVETINSLPDTSAYIATAGGTNAIKFRGDSGSATDGGAINTLTEAEIAVATNKGWTVTLS